MSTKRLKNPPKDFISQCMKLDALKHGGSWYMDKAVFKLIKQMKESSIKDDTDISKNS